MTRIVFNKKEYYVTDSTPLLVVVNSERSLTIAKFIIDGKEYIVRVNEIGKAQMT